MKKHNYRTDFLFPTNTFWIGFGSAINLGGNYFKYNYSESGMEADIKAIENDWKMVGEDLKDAIETTHKKLESQGYQLEIDFNV